MHSDYGGIDFIIRWEWAGRIIGDQRVLLVVYHIVAWDLISSLVSYM